MENMTSGEFVEFIHLCVTLETTWTGQGEIVVQNMI